MDYLQGSTCRQAGALSAKHSGGLTGDPFKNLFSARRGHRALQVK